MIRCLVHESYLNLSKIAFKLMTLLGSTYLCESLFSDLNFIKDKYFTRLNDAHTRQLLMIHDSCKRKGPITCVSLTVIFEELYPIVIVLFVICRYISFHSAFLYSNSGCLCELS